MKKVFAIMALLYAGFAFGQTFPVQNLTVNGTANLLGPSNFSQSPIMPTPPVGDNTNNGATTAFVKQNYIPLSSLSGLAPIASPVFTGTPLAPTAARGNNTQQLATTNFVQANQNCTSIMAYGGDPTFATNNDGAWASAIAAENLRTPGLICISFPAGTFKFAASISTLVPVAGTITIVGQGSDTTRLVFPAGDGMVVNMQNGYSTLHIKGFSLLTQGTLSGDALRVTQTSGQPNEATSDISDITCRGADGYVQSQVWTNCIHVMSVSFINFTNINAVGNNLQQGTGVTLEATLPSYGIVYNFVACNFEHNFVGLYYGNYIQGVTMNQSNMTAGINGIVVPPSSAGAAQLSVTMSQFNQQNYAILFQSNLPATSIIGNYFFCNTLPGSNCINLYQPGLISIMGNVFQGNHVATQYGIAATLFSAPTTVVGNVFWNLGDGIHLPAGTGAFNVQSNGYVSNINNVNNAGSNVIGGGSP